MVYKASWKSEVNLNIHSRIWRCEVWQKFVDVSKKYSATNLGSAWLPLLTTCLAHSSTQIVLTEHQPTSTRLHGVITVKILASARNWNITIKEKFSEPLNWTKRNQNQHSCSEFGTGLCLLVEFGHVICSLLLVDGHNVINRRFFNFFFETHLKFVSCEHLVPIYIQVLD